MRPEPKCTHVLEYGAVGATVEDETESKVCLAVATWRVTAPGVRPKFRCDEHVGEYRTVQTDWPELGVVIEPLA